MEGRKHSPEQVIRKLREADQLTDSAMTKLRVFVRRNVACDCPTGKSN